MLYSGSPHFTEALELEIIHFLPHTGAIACTSKEGRRLVDEGGDDQCCPCRQFHHPKDATLMDPHDSYSSFDYKLDDRNKLFLEENKYDADNSGSDSMMGLNAWEWTREMKGNNEVWTC